MNYLEHKSEAINYLNKSIKAMSKTGTNLLFLAVGAVLGAAVGYIAASDKKEQWLNDIGGLVNKIKDNVRSSSKIINDQILDDLE